MIAWAGVTIDSRDPARLAAFWSALLDRPAHPAGDDRPGWWRIEPAVAGGPVLNFQPVPEGHGEKAPVHLDLWVDDLPAATAKLEALGGSLTGAREVIPTRGTIVVARDPEGHELCLISADRD